MIRWWLALALVAAVALGALAWVGRAAARAEASARATREEVAREEAARLALWRMDALLAPRLARQAAQPYFAWASFYPAGAAYGRMFDAARDEASLVPSPLLASAGSPSDHVLAHVQIGPDGALASPQVPRGHERDLAIGRGLLDPAAIAAREVMLARLEPLVAGDALARALSVSPDAAPRVSCDVRGVVLENYAVAQVPDEQDLAAPTKQSSFASSVTSARARSIGEFSKRAASYRDAANSAQIESAQFAEQGRPGGDGMLELGLMLPVRIGGELLLAREVRLGDRRWLQAAWLDWPALERELLAIARADLPDARLVADDGAQPEHRLASLPLVLDPGVRLTTALPAGDDGVGAMLALAWTAAAIALAVAALLLRGALSLSQRRGAFVSAVTHEMRTPLTTFRLYADLLASDMIVDRTQRESCLATLRTEADRLGHLVENVLAYARLERRAPATEALPAGELVARCRDRLAARAAQAGLELVVADGDAAAVAVRADADGIERVLMNLVDNAAKYAAAATDRRLEIACARDGRRVRITVRDHGPGVAADARRRLFAPFAKSSADAARTAPGVGLGLALSRRLLRRQGGDLVHLDGDGGACFAIVLPRAE